MAKPTPEHEREAEKLIDNLMDKWRKDNPIFQESPYPPDPRELKDPIAQALADAEEKGKKKGFNLSQDASWLG